MTAPHAIYILKYLHFDSLVAFFWLVPELRLVILGYSAVMRTAEVNAFCRICLMQTSHFCQHL